MWNTWKVKFDSGKECIFNEMPLVRVIEKISNCYDYDFRLEDVVSIERCYQVVKFPKELE